jgi:amino acid adenylation domain-containing protein/thioester reductase-like protein
MSQLLGNQPLEKKIFYLAVNQNEKEKTYWMDLVAEWESPSLLFPGRKALYPVEKVKNNFTIPQDLSKKIYGLCGDNDNKAFLFLAAVLAVLVNKYTGRKRFFLGAPIFSKTFSQQLVNKFILLDVQAEDARSIREMLGTLKETMLAGIQNQNFPLSLLPELNGLSFDSKSAFPYMEVALLLENIHDARLLDNSHHPLTFGFKRENDSYSSWLAYHPGYCSAEEAASLSGRFLLLAEAILSSLDHKVGDLSIITQGEREIVLKNFNQYRLPLPAEESTIALIKKQVLANPEKIALREGELSYTYAALWNKALKAAGFLQSCTQVNDIVAIHSPSSAEMIAAILACHLSGRGYLPVDPKMPAARISYMLENSDASLVLTTDRQAIPTSVVAKELSVIFDEAQASATEVLPKGEDTAYVIYTSGSTGQPKGVEVAHRALLNLCIWHMDYYGLTTSDKVTKMANVSFDASVWEIFPCLCAGAELVIIQEDMKMDLPALNQYMEEQGITVSFMPTQLGEQFMKLENKCLRYLLVGGDKLRLFEQRPYKIVNNYGPTESTVVTTAGLIEQYADNLPIGKPIANVEVYILRPDSNELLPPGVVGELCIGGNSVAKGYLGQAELTAASFVDNPFRQNEKMYRSGDLARWLLDGQIEFLGRIDHQVQVRGFRVDLGEIEQVLLRQQDIRDAAVIYWQENGQEPMLSAYIVAEGTVNAEALRETLRLSLPDYMIPVFVTQLEQLPLSSSGKVDRRALPKPQMDEVVFVQPKEAIEATVANIWEEVLQLNPIGRVHHFFKSGGDSLKSIQVISRLSQAGYKARVADLFAKPVLKDFAVTLVAVEAPQTIKSIESPDNLYPLSQAQRRLWILEQLSGGRSAYHMPSAFLLSGKLNEKALRAAYQQMASRHEILRTVFLTVDEEPRMHVLETPAEAVTIQLVASPELLDQAIQQVVQQPFSLTEGPLFRIDLLNLPEEEMVMVLNMHHIISDGWSMSILVEELMACYNAACKETTAQLPELDIQYKDYAGWLAERMHSDAYKAHQEYWHQQLAGRLPVLNLPTDFKRPQVKSYEGDMKVHHFSSALLQKLKALAAKEEVSLYTVVVALVNLLLYRYTDDSDILIGTPIAGRSHMSTEKLIGLFANTVVLRTRMEESQSFKGLLAAVSSTVSEAIEHQEYPFDLLVDELKLQRDMAHTPVFDVMVAMQNKQVSDLQLDHLTITPKPIQEKVSKFDLLFNFIETEEELVLGIEYSTELFLASRIERIFQHLEVLAEAVAADPGQALLMLPLTTKEERSLLLQHFAIGERKDYPAYTLQQWLAVKVTEQPDAIALIMKGSTRTYSEVFQESSTMTAALQAAGVRAGDTVGIVMDRSEYLVIGMLAVMMAGGAYVPVDPANPDDRIHFVLQDAGCTFVLADPDKLERVKAMNLTAQVVTPKELPTGNALAEMKGLPADTAYIIYTSGSTGMPKGVAVCHRTLVNLLGWFTDQYNFDATERFLLKTNHTFDVSLTELFGWIPCGGSLAILPPGQEKDPEAILTAVQQYGITHLNFSPSMLQAFTTTLGSRLQEMETLKMLVVAGEAFPPTLAAQVWHAAPSLLLENLYGPTEATVYTTRYAVGKADLEQVSMPIGRPVTNAITYILDKNLEPCPLGVNGELYIGGENLVLSYANRPELTAERFVENPFRKGERMYRTGDICSWLADGNIAYFGRTDHQVKVRGFRIEMGEIEHTLLQHEQVQQAAVLLKKQGDDPLLVAYVAAEGTTQEEISAFLAGKLPHYMVPSVIILVEQLPLNQNGKIDRGALPEPDFSSRRAFVAPSGAAELQLATLWAEILHIDKDEISALDNFFERGGQSLRAIRLAAHARQHMGATLEVQDIFRKPVLRDMAALMQAMEKAPAFVLPKAVEQERYPLSAAQHRIYLMQQMSPGSTLYNIPSVAAIEKADPAQLKEALKLIIARHEALRTSFHQPDGEEPYQQVGNPEIKLETHHVAAAAAALEKTLSSMVRPFDLSKAPLIRAELVTTDDNRCYLFTDMHHIISDAHSMQIITKDFEAILNGKSLPENTLQYKDFAVWEQSEDAAQHRKKNEEYWLEKFTGEIPKVELPADKKRPKVQSYRGAVVSQLISAGQREKISAFLQKRGTTFNTFFFTLYNLLLYKLSGEQDLIVGMPVSGREMPGTEEIVGMFVNTLPIRQQVNAEKGFDFMLAETYEFLGQALQHQSYPLERLIEQLQVAKDPSRHPLFTLMYNYLHKSATEGASFNLYNHSKFDLTLTLQEGEKDFRASIEYATGLFTEETAADFLRMYLSLAELVINAPTLPLKQHSLIGPEEAASIKGWNPAPSDYPKLDLVSLLEQQVAVQPEAIALKLAEQTLTYRELNEKAEKLAAKIHLLAGSEKEIVGMRFGRSLDMIVAIWAILKAGHAYLPVDPKTPEDRLAYMLQDSNTTLLLTNLSDTQAPEGVACFNTNNMNWDVAERYRSNDIQSDDRCYIIYTSGTTGTPKGVVIRHSNVVKTVINTNYITLSPADTVLQWSNYSFDGSVFDIFGALLNGARLIMIHDDEVGDTEALLQIIENEKISVFFVTTALFNALIEKEAKVLVGIRHVLFGGERVSFQHIKKAWKLMGPGKLIHCYGPTETTVFATTLRVDTLDEEDYTLPIGSAISNTTLFILDEQLQLVPAGVRGEIYLGGEGLAEGYLHQEERTASRFVHVPGLGRLYRTGDMARWRRNGVVEYLDRADDQVKLRGYRVELGEIEARIREVAGVREAVVVVANADDSSKKLLAAYYTADGELTAEQVRHELNVKLPAYMVPGFLMQLEELPLTKNKKVDKRRLPEPVIESSNNFEAPANEVEHIIVECWSNVLKIDASKISVHDDFFALGGNSILALNLITMLQEHFEVSINDLFQHTTVRGMANNVGYEKNYLKNKLESYVAKMKAMDLVEQMAAKELRKLENKQKRKIADQKKPYLKNMKQLRKLNLKKRLAYKNTLLLGGTGYLGVHILEQLLRTRNDNFTLIVRGRSNEDARERLDAKFRFYFNRSLESYGNRLSVYAGDVTASNMGLDAIVWQQLAQQVDCIINAAANVKHYGRLEEFLKINADSIGNMVRFCQEGSKKVIHHISTLSISGGRPLAETEAEREQEEIIFTESEMDKGQVHANFYNRSKFEAELLLSRAREEGIICNIYRVANLSFQSYSGKFQENIENNAFYNQIRGFLTLGGIIDDHGKGMEISCIDRLAEAFSAIYDRVALLNRNFHLQNNKLLTAKKLSAYAATAGYHLDIIDLRDFLERMMHAYETHKVMINRLMLQYNVFGDDRSVNEPYHICSDETDYLLKKLGFKWNTIEKKQIKKMLEYGRCVNFFH